MLASQRVSRPACLRGRPATRSENEANRCQGARRDLPVIDGIRVEHFRLPGLIRLGGARLDLVDQVRHHFTPNVSGKYEAFELQPPEQVAAVAAGASKRSR